MSMNFLYLDPFKRYKLPKSIPVFKAAYGSLLFPSLAGIGVTLAPLEADNQ